jgi:hypothetical protein
MLTSFIQNAEAVAYLLLALRWEVMKIVMLLTVMVDFVCDQAMVEGAWRMESPEGGKPGIFVV